METAVFFRKGERGLNRSGGPTYREVTISNDTLGSLVGGRNMFDNS